MEKHFFRIVLVLAVVSAICHAAGQRKIVRELSSGEDIFIHEIGAMIAMEEDKMKVLDVMPKDVRRKEYKDVDIQEGDVVVMVNGNRMKSALDLKKIYEEAAIGSEIKFGIRRGDQPMIVGVRKADPKTLPQQRIVRSSGMPGDGELLPGLGMFGKEGKNIVVRLVLPAEKGQPELLKEKDILKSINGQSFKTLDKLSKYYESIRVGDKIEIQALREGKVITLSTTKAAPKGPVIIRRRN